MAGENELADELRELADKRKDPLLLAAARQIERLQAERRMLLAEFHNQSLSRRIDAWWNGAGE